MYVRKVMPTVVCAIYAALRNKRAPFVQGFFLFPVRTHARRSASLSASLAIARAF